MTAGDVKSAPCLVDEKYGDAAIAYGIFVFERAPSVDGGRDAVG